MPAPFASGSQAHPMPYHHPLTEPFTSYRAVPQRIVYGAAAPLYAHQHGVPPSDYSNYLPHVPGGPQVHYPSFSS